MIDQEKLLRAYERAKEHLLSARAPSDHWIGELSASALSTATALSALSLAYRSPSPLLGEGRGEGSSSASLKAAPNLITSGIRWLVEHQNADGGWGDTDKSLSNIATTMLVEAAFHLTGTATDHGDLLAKAASYIRGQGGIAGLRRRYGRDKTFAVPILTNAALAGLVPWSEVAPLPFELACFPQAWFRWLQLPVVSYAIPALVAVGQARNFHAPPTNPIVRTIRSASTAKSLAVLQRMQPASGGFLEATPLTSFVVMSLASIGQADHPVTCLGVEFLLASARPDGSWPIDTNLATWLTTLSINALAGAEEPPAEPTLINWLLGCQHRQRHPFTGAAAGGWGWSDLSGAVPDADDTAGALLALAAMENSWQDHGPRIMEAATAGVDWLLGLQNRDGGWPTFCRGWGALPFDRSGTDLTAHVLRALHVWQLRLAMIPPNLSTRDERYRRQRVGRIERAIDRGFAYLADHQRPDGSWVPLWFGNQVHADEENPVYGTARVLLAYRDTQQPDARPARRGLAWLVANQNHDGGWGGSEKPPGTNQRTTASSVEETALAVEALLAAGPGLSVQLQVEKGLNWLMDTVEQQRHQETSPIGFYFAKLWYYERLYPLIFTVSALGQAVGRLLPRLKPEPALARQTT